MKVTKISLHHRSLKYGRQQHFASEKCPSVVFCNYTLVKLSSMLFVAFSLWGNSFSVWCHINLCSKMGRGNGQKTNLPYLLELVNSHGGQQKKILRICMYVNCTYVQFILPSQTLHSYEVRNIKAYLLSLLYFLACMLYCLDINYLIESYSRPPTPCPPVSLPHYFCISLGV